MNLGQVGTSRVRAADVASVVLVLAGAIACGLSAVGFSDSNDLAGLFWAAFAAASLSAAVRFSTGTRRRR